MKRDPNLTLVPPPPDEEAWTSDAERQYDLGLISADGAREKSGLPVSEHATDELDASAATSKALGNDAMSQTTQLELVTDPHVPDPGARREAKLKSPRKPRNWRERMAADQAPPHQQVKPLGHDPILTVHQGGKRKTR